MHCQNCRTDSPASLERSRSSRMEPIPPCPAERCVGSITHKVVPELEDAATVGDQARFCQPFGGFDIFFLGETCHLTRDPVLSKGAEDR
jgi:hypothetical protein